MKERFSITTETKGKLPSLPFLKVAKKIKNAVLGENYSLSIAFVGKKRSQEINKKYRNKDKPTNVLSFALRKEEGELVLCESVIKKEVKDTGKTSNEYLAFLLIHGMLHLKGLEHGDRMEKLEKKYLSLAKFP
jgi:probable rRNA maturation factor